jgi:hypothetical protein
MGNLTTEQHALRLEITFLRTAMEFVASQIRQEFPAGAAELERTVERSRKRIADE